MGFGKAFGAGIAVFLGLMCAATVLITVVLGLQSGDIMTALTTWLNGLTTDPIGWVLGLLTGNGYSGETLGMMLFYAQSNFYLGTVYPGWMIAGISFLIVPIFFLVTALIVGYLSHSPQAGFGAMIIICFIGAAIAVIAGLIYSLIYTTMYLNVALIVDIIVSISIPGVVNGLAFGAIAMAMGYQYEE